MDERDRIVAEIAKRILRLDTLETRKSGLDFKEQAVWAIKEALETAYRAGEEYGRMVGPTREDMAGHG